MKIYCKKLCEKLLYYIQTLSCDKWDWEGLVRKCITESIISQQLISQSYVYFRFFIYMDFYGHCCWEFGIYSEFPRFVLILPDCTQRCQYNYFYYPQFNKSLILCTEIHNIQFFLILSRKWVYFMLQNEYLWSYCTVHCTLTNWAQKDLTWPPEIWDEFNNWPVMKFKKPFKFFWRPGMWNTIYTSVIEDLGSSLPS